MDKNCFSHDLPTYRWTLHSRIFPCSKPNTLFFVVLLYPFTKEKHSTQRAAHHSFLPILAATSYQSGKVSSLAILHQDVDDGARSVNDAIVVANYVTMLQLSQQVHLWHQELFFCLWHGAIVHLLPHHNLWNKWPQWAGRPGDKMQ